MNVFKATFVSAALAAVVLFGSQAHADIIVSINGIAKADDPTNTFASFGGAVGTFNINSITSAGVGAFGGNAELADNGSFDISTHGSGSLTILLTETNLTLSGPSAIFGLDFTGTISNAAVTRSFFLDTSNSGSESVLLGSTSGANAMFDSAPQPLSGPFSITEEIDVTATGAGATLSADDAVFIPEPVSLSLVGLGLLTLAGLGRFRRA
jgi:hypothetical protein